LTFVVTFILWELSFVAFEFLCPFVSAKLQQPWVCDRFDYQFIYLFIYRYAPWSLDMVFNSLQAGSVEGQVVEMGLTTTSLLNAEKFPVIVPNSMFSSQVHMLSLPTFRLLKYPSLNKLDG